MGKAMYLTQALKRTAQIAGGEVATSCAGRVRTWRECRDRVARMAGALHKLGLGAGDRAAVLALNSDRYFEFYYAVSWPAASSCRSISAWRHRKSHTG